MTMPELAGGIKDDRPSISDPHECERVMKTRSVYPMPSCVRIAHFPALQFSKVKHLSWLSSIWVTSWNIGKWCNVLQYYCAAKFYPYARRSRAAVSGSWVWNFDAGITDSYKLQNSSKTETTGITLETAQLLVVPHGSFHRERKAVTAQIYISICTFFFLKKKMNAVESTHCKLCTLPPRTGSDLAIDEWSLPHMRKNRPTPVYL